MYQHSDVLEFWFGSDPKFWFAKNDAFDASIRNQFGMMLEEARLGNLRHWEEEADSLLALIILLDQFSRNLFRGLPIAFSHDGIALALAHRLVEMPEFDAFSPEQKMFGVMPMMHSEELEEQRACLRWMEKIGVEAAINAAKEHLMIIEKFSRFPHRNDVLGRWTTEEESEFLKAGGFSG